MNEAPSPSKLKTGAVAIVAVVFILAAIVLQSLALDIFEWVTSGTFIECVLNWLSRAYLWVAIGVGVLIVLASLIRGSKNA